MASTCIALIFSFFSLALECSHSHIAYDRVSCFTADVDRRPCSDSRHVTAPYKSALYYYYYLLGQTVMSPFTFTAQRIFFYTYIILTLIFHVKLG